MRKRLSVAVAAVVCEGTHTLGFSAPLRVDEAPCGGSTGLGVAEALEPRTAGGVGKVPVKG